MSDGRRHWFMPETPDVLGMLRTQIDVTLSGLDALVDWAEGDAGAATRVRASEHEADEHKRTLQAALVRAFTTPYDAEDIYSLCRGTDRILNLSKDAVRESEVMACAPDAPIAEMARLLREAVGHLADAVEGLDHRDARATDFADDAIKAERKLEKVYRNAMGQLIAVDDLREVSAKRELYRRFSRIGDAVTDVAERVWYTVVKEA